MFSSSLKIDVLDSSSAGGTSSKERTPLKDIALVVFSVQIQTSNSLK